MKDSIYAEVLHRDRCVGGLVIFNFRHEKAFSDSDLRLLQAIADDIAIALEREQLAKEADEARALYEADRLRSQFISSVSHELRTPLTIIKGYATSLLRQNVSWDKETQLDFLKTIDEKTDELRDLIDKILQSAKLEAGALRLEKEPLLLPRVARKVVEENIPRTKKHQFIVQFPPSFPVVEADARCIEQVIRNLVENAVKYSPDGGDIVISGQVGDGEIVVSISDKGVGIPQKSQDKIFERFFRGIALNPLYTGRG
jgi:K+-sensing histidine kinase KdpD